MNCIELHLFIPVLVIMVEFRDHIGSCVFLTSSFLVTVGAGAYTYKVMCNLKERSIIIFKNNSNPPVLLEFMLVDSK